MSDSYMCPECTGIVEGDSGHRVNCPVLTNWWTVPTEHGVMCFLCDDWIEEGQQYRILPLLPEEQDDFDPEADIGRLYPTGIKIVCGECSGLRLIVSSPLGLDATTFKRSR